MNTAILLAVEMLKPRALIAQVCASKRPTDTPVASRSASASVVMPARRRSSAVITSIADAASLTGSACFETEVTSIRESSSIERRPRVWSGSFVGEGAEEAPDSDGRRGAREHNDQQERL